MKPSPWKNTPQALRTRKKVHLTLPPEVIAKLELLARRHGNSKSAAVEALILATPL